MANVPDNIKTFNMRISKEMWSFLKQTSIVQDRSMTDIVSSCLDKYKKKIESKSTNNDQND